MVVIKQFWTPCYWYDDVKTALIPIVAYTSLFSVIMITYTSYVLDGGESSQFYMPYFETDRYTSLPWVGGFVIIYMLLLFFSGFSLRRGVQIENRGMMLPWLALMSGILIYQLWLGLWLLYSYYIYLQTVFVVLIDWLWMSYNIYVWLAIYSMYQEIRLKQNPSFDYIY